MKKILSIALVALLAASAFAGFSGEANVGLGYNWETGAFGFSNGTGFDVNLDLASADAEAIAEGDVYAGIKASAALKVANQEGTKGFQIWTKDIKEGFGLGLFLKVSEAYVAGENWKVSILGTQGAPDFAKSAIDGGYQLKVEDAFGNKYDYKYVPATYAVSAIKTPGVTVEVMDWKASFGFNGNDGSKADPKFFNYNAFVQTPVFDFDVVNLQVAAIASRDMTNEDLTKRFDSAIGASAKLGFDTDVVTGSVAADYGVKLVKGADDKYVATHGMDVAANLAISPVTVDLYFQNANLSNNAKKTGDDLLALNLLSAQAAVDLNSFDVPLKLTVFAKNVLDKINGQTFGAKVETTVDAFTLKANGSYQITDKQKLSVGASAEYKHDLFKVGAGLTWSMLTKKGLEDTHRLVANASVSSDAIIPGATLSLAYGAGDEDMNLLKQAGSGYAQNFGKIEAKCAIEF